MSDRQPPDFPSEDSSNAPPDDIKGFELNLLKEEYFFIQNIIEDYNKQIWVIKALGITGTGALLGLALQQGQNLFALVGCAIPIFFWILESQWKHFQRGFYPRVAELENILLNGHQLRGPAIYTVWSRSLKRSAVPKRQGYLWDGLLNPSVFVSYILEIGFLLIVYVLDLV
jgi:hypothetical protein